MRQIAGILLFSLMAVLTPWAGAEEIPALYMGHTGEVIIPESKAFSDFGGTPTETHTTGGITFRLFYEDVRLSNGIGFNGPNGTAARARVRDVLDYLADILNETGTLDIHQNVSQTGGSSSLASCGTFYSVANGINDPSSLRRIRQGSKPFVGFPEMQGTVDFGHNWNFTSGATTTGQFDFFSVMLHEFTHGLGLAGLTTSTGTSAFSGNGAPNARTRFDRNLVRGQGGTSIISAAGVFTGLVADLTSNNLFSNGTATTEQYDQGGVQPGVYAPTPFATGSSLSHWNTGAIAGGAVMEHAIAPAVNRREYAGVDIGGLIDLGWTNIEVAAEEGEGAAEGEGETDPPTVSIINNGGTYVEEDGGISLEADVQNGPAISFQLTKNNANIPLATGATFEKLNVSPSDSGAYRVRIETAAKAIVTSDPVLINVVPVGGLPVGGTLGLAAVAVACAFAGGIRLRKRR